MGVRPTRELVQVVADARDLPGALALDILCVENPPESQGFVEIYQDGATRPLTRQEAAEHEQKPNAPATAPPRARTGASEDWRLAISAPSASPSTFSVTLGSSQTPHQEKTDYSENTENHS